MSTIPAPAILEIEALLEALYVDPSSGKKEAKIVYRPSSASCLVQVHFNEIESPSKQLDLDVFLFEKVRQLGYVREISSGEKESHHEYCLTDDIFALAEINSIRTEWLKAKKDREEKRAKMAAQPPQDNPQ